MTQASSSSNTNFPQLNDLKPEELVRHTKQVLNYAAAEYAEAAAVAEVAMGAVWQEKANMLNARTFMDDQLAEDRRRTIVTMWTNFVRDADAWGVKARIESARAKAAAERGDETDEIPMLADSCKIEYGLDQLNYDGSLDEFESQQAHDLLIERKKVAKDAFARLKGSRDKFVFARNVWNFAKASLSWNRRLGTRGGYSISRNMTEGIARNSQHYRNLAISGLNRIHREQIMGKWRDEVIDAERAGKFIKRRTRKNRKKTKRRKQQIAKRIKGTRRRK